MSATPITPDFNETLNVKVSLSPKLTFNLALLVNELTETVDFLFSQGTHLSIRTDIGLS